MYKLRSIISALWKLSFQICTPGTGPYVGSWGLTIFDRNTREIIVSLCLTSDGWCVRPFHSGAGLYRKGSAFSKHSGDTFSPLYCYH